LLLILVTVAVTESQRDAGSDFVAEIDAAVCVVSVRVVLVAVGAWIIQESGHDIVKHNRGGGADKNFVPIILQCDPAHLLNLFDALAFGDGGPGIQIVAATRVRRSHPAPVDVSQRVVEGEGKMVRLAFDRGDEAMGIVTLRRLVMINDKIRRIGQ